MKKILLVAYHFHPDLEVGAQRTIKFAKYLPKFGWEPHVLSARPYYYRSMDDSPLDFSCEVFRTSKLPVLDDFYLTLKKLLRRRPRIEKVPETTQLSRGVPATARDREHLTWLKKLEYTLSSTPDRTIGWFLPALYRAVRLTRRYRYEAIYTSGPPQTCHLVGLFAHFTTGAPLVVDFRDPWLYEKKHYELGLPFSRRFDEYFERLTVRRASLILTTTDDWREHLARAYGSLVGQKCHAIVNGFDQDEFDDAGKPEEKQAGRLIFIHAGNLYSGRDPYAFLAAAAELLGEGLLQKDEASFKFYGGWSEDVNRVRIVNLADGSHLQGALELKRAVGRNEYLRIIKQADVLVLIQSDLAKVHIPAKAFEYLATGNYILVLTPEGATKNYMAQFENAYIADLNDKEQIKIKLREILDRLRKKRYPNVSRSKIEQLTKLKLTERLAGLLDRLPARQ